MRERLYEIIFEADTAAGKLFDIVLLFGILASIGVVMLDSVQSFHDEHVDLLWRLELGFTVLFTAEYVLRLAVVRRPLRYAVSFFGIIDLLAVLPTYLSLMFDGAQSLMVIRALRLLRVFRVFKLGRFIGEAIVLGDAMRRSVPKLIVFLITVATAVVIVGTGMYLIEGRTNPGFDNIPKSVYWAIVTVTTVGYGDSVPVTAGGKALAACLMIVGFAIIAVPTGIVAAEFVRHPGRGDVTTQVCPQCLAEGHDGDAAFCKHCGADLAKQ